jgi:hypothetical protein
LLQKGILQKIDARTYRVVDEASREELAGA